MVFWRGLVRIVVLLPVAKSLQHFGRRDSVASGMLLAEHYIGLDDLHNGYAHRITNRLVLVDS